MRGGFPAHCLHINRARPFHPDGYTAWQERKMRITLHILYSYLYAVTFIIKLNTHPAHVLIPSARWEGLGANDGATTHERRGVTPAASPLFRSDSHRLREHAFCHGCLFYLQKNVWTELLMPDFFPPIRISSLPKRHLVPLLLRVCRLSGHSVLRWWCRFPLHTGPLSRERWMQCCCCSRCPLTPPANSWKMHHPHKGTNMTGAKTMYLFVKAKSSLRGG